MLMWKSWRKIFVGKVSLFPNNKFVILKVLKILWCNEIFSCKQLCQDVKVFCCFRGWLLPHKQGVAGGLVEPKLMTRCPTLCCVYIFLAQAWYSVQPLWLVGRVKRSLHFAWVVYCWSWMQPLWLFGGVKRSLHLAWAVDCWLWRALSNHQ